MPEKDFDGTDDFGSRWFYQDLVERWSLCSGGVGRPQCALLVIIIICYLSVGYKVSNTDTNTPTPWLSSIASNASTASY